jgi:hypothetical protein
MNSFDLISLHRDTYPNSHITPETIDTILYQLIKLTSDVEESLRPVLIRGTAYELVHKSYSGAEANELRTKVEKRFKQLYDSSCLCWFLCVT